MIELPTLDDVFAYENNFYLSCDNQRIEKLLAHYELLKMSLGAEGDIFEFGVLKGASFVRFAAFREVLGLDDRQLVGFDSFAGFPETEFEPDKELRAAHIRDAGAESIGKDQLLEVLENKRVTTDIRLVEGDITQSLPAYLAEYPDTRASFINLDVDIYEPSRVILETMYPRLSPGGILVLDDYNSFPGETKAVNDYFASLDIEVSYLDFCKSPCYVRKPELSS